MNSSVTGNLLACELYLEGRFELHRRSAASIRRSKVLFEQAIGLDPALGKAVALVALISQHNGDWQAARSGLENVSISTRY